MLTTAELRDLSHPSATRSWRAILLDVAVIAGLLAGNVAWPHPLLVALSVLVMGRQQLALAILMHDGAHRRLFRSARWNDLVSQWMLAGPLFFSMHGYKILHLKHHKAPLAAEDPDLSLTGGYPIDSRSFARKLVRDATGLSYLKFLRYFVQAARQRTPGQPKPARSSEKPHLATRLGSTLGTNLALLAGLWALGRPDLYLWLWLMPAFTVLQVLLRIRGVAEHAGYQPTQDQRRCSRTVRPGWQAFILAPHHVHYHIEHHVYPSVPFHQLPKVHALLRQRGSLPEGNLFADYGAVLRALVR